MFVDFWYEIYESVKRKPTRAILTGIGITWGIFILIILVGIGSGFERGVFKLFSGFSKSMTYVYASQTTMSYEGTSVGRKITFIVLNILRSSCCKQKRGVHSIFWMLQKTGMWY